MSTIRPPDPDNPFLAVIGWAIVGALIGAGCGFLLFLPLGLIPALVGGMAYGLFGLACGTAAGGHWNL